MQLCEPWPLVVADFASEYGERLATSTLTWPEFRILLDGLLAADTRLARYFASNTTEEG